MAASDNFCLRMNSFEINVKTAWKEMQMEKDFSDITLACGDKQIKTHKIVICFYSPVLRDILKVNSNPHPLIYLRKVKYKDLLNLVNFMYQGEVNIVEEDLQSFLEVAEDLNVRGLSEGNVEGCNSNEDNTSQFSNSKSTDPLPKRNISTIKNENMSESKPKDSTSEYIPADDSFVNNGNDNVNLLDSTTEYVPADDSFGNNGNDNDNLLTRREIMNKRTDSDISHTTVSTLTGKQFMCRKCNKEYSSFTGLNIHTKSIHEGVQYSCDTCGYKATQKSNLKKHIMSIHEGHQYPCDECNYKATDKSNLCKHQLKYHN